MDRHVALLLATTNRKDSVEVNRTRDEGVAASLMLTDAFQLHRHRQAGVIQKPESQEPTPRFPASWLLNSSQPRLALPVAWQMMPWH